MSMEEFSWDGIRAREGLTEDPAAGAQLAVITVPANKKWLFMNAHSTIICSAAVATRACYIIMRATNGGLRTFTMYGNNSITATLVRGTSFCPGTGVSAVIDIYETVGIGQNGLEVPANGTIQVGYNLLQAADNIAVMSYLYKEAPA